MAFESLPGIKIKDPTTKRAYILADFFSVYENYEGDDDALPDIYQWSDFLSVSETKNSFSLKTATYDRRPDKEFVLSADLIPDPRTWIRVRAIIEGAIAGHTDVEYNYGRRVLPPKTISSGCDVPVEAYVATGVYEEGEINNSNVVFLNRHSDKLIWAVAPFVTVAAFIAQLLYFGGLTVMWNVITYGVIAVMAGAVAGISAYLFSAYSAKTLYRKLLKSDPAVLEEITFVVCEKGFIAVESRFYDFSDIIHWQRATYYMETNHMYIIFSDNKTAFWMPKRLFPKEIHQELSDFIADRLLQKPMPGDEQRVKKSKKPKTKTEKVKV